MTNLATIYEPRGSSVKTCALTKSFNGVCVLQPTNLEIPKGEILVLLGPSGCGKTTLLRLIAGLEQPDNPHMIYFDGDDITSIPIEKRNVGMVFQSYALFPNMTVAQNIAYGLKIRKIRQDKRIIETQKLLELVGLEDYAHRNIADLSGGQRQRTALARALAIKPRILLLDEPLAALDAVLREKLRVEIGVLLREFGITAVYVTHDQAEAMAIGDRIAVMQKGKIVQIDKPQNIYHRPVNSFVADFVGTMNRLQGEVKNGLFHRGNAQSFIHLPMHGNDRLCHIGFRPEAVRLEKKNPNIIARIRATTFFGASQRLIVEVDNEIELQLDLASNINFTLNDFVGFYVEPSAIIEFQEDI